MILEEGNQTYPRCPKCDMFFSHKTLNDWHRATAFCRKGEESKRRRLEEEEVRAGTDTVITAYEPSLSPVTSFK